MNCDGLSAAQLAVLTAARARQVAHDQARLLADAVALVVTYLVGVPYRVGQQSLHRVR